MLMNFLRDDKIISMLACLNFFKCLSPSQAQDADGSERKRKTTSSFRKLLEKTNPSPASFRPRAASNANQLTEPQKDLIRSTWKEVSKRCKYDPGIKIFQRIFRRCPELKPLFQLDRLENLDDLPADKNFVRHARVFSSVIDLTVRNLDELHSQIAPALITLGRRHFYKHHVGFRPEYVAVFATALMEFVMDHVAGSEESRQQEVAEAWWAITVYMVTKLKLGYELESMHKDKRQLNWPSGTETK